MSDKINDQIRGVHKIKEIWAIYDPLERKLSQILPANDLLIISEAATMRNKLVHGQKVFKIAEYKDKTALARGALDRMVAISNNEYGYSGWTLAKRRNKSKLHVDAKVTWTK